MTSTTSLETELARHARTPLEDAAVKSAQLMHRAIQTAIQQQDFELAADLRDTAFELLKQVSPPQINPNTPKAPNQ